jgi:hypothetical protein
VRRDQALEVVVGQAPVDAVTNGAAVASRSRLTRARPMRQMRTSVRRRSMGWSKALRHK